MKNTTNTTNSSLFKISSVLWGIWGMVHIGVGIFILLSDATSSLQGMADAVDPKSLMMNYPDALGAILKQHGFNLLWIGLVTFISAFWIWKGNKNAIFLAAICGGLADLGYFIFMDLGGYVHFIIGGLMTYVSGAAIILSFYAYYKSRKIPQAD